MTIGIDMDDTICSTNERIIVEADKYDKEVLGGTGIKDINAYEFSEMMGWPEGMKGQFFSDRLEYIMDNAEIKPGAKDVINTLYDRGFNIIFISFRKGKYIKDPYKLTKNWLDRNGVKYTKIYVDTGSKVDECIKEGVNLFIDDKESHCEDVSSAGIDVLLFTNAYNHDEKRFRRVDTWNEVLDYVEEKYNG
ncbi:MAG: hypothetical protein IJK67_05830 [Bacilli bacterium]|nr:hypothetical protein [Bacilli bacterium]